MNNKYVLHHYKPCAELYFNIPFNSNVYNITLCALRNGNITVDSIGADITANKTASLNIDKTVKIEVLYCYSYKLPMRTSRSGECFSTGQIYFRVVDNDKAYLIDDRQRNMNAFYVRNELFSVFDTIAVFYKLAEDDCLLTPQQTDKQPQQSSLGLHFRLKNKNTVEVTNSNGSFDYVLDNGNFIENEKDFLEVTKKILNRVLLNDNSPETVEKAIITTNDKVVLSNANYLATDLSMSGISFILGDQPHSVSVRYGYRQKIQSGALIYHVIGTKVYNQNTFAIITDFDNPNHAPVYIVDVRGLRKVD